MFKKLLNIMGDSNEKELKRLDPIVDKINSLEPDFEGLSLSQLQSKTEEFKERLNSGDSLEDILPEAFAAVRESARQVLGLRHYDVQLVGGIVLHQGKIAEMKTGEGKTLAATLPIYLNALTGNGVHVITVNDYLSKRDTQWMGPVYLGLGLNIGCIQHDAAFLYDPEYDSGDDDWPHLKPVNRQEAYGADITYGTNNEFGFDYLRDNMVAHITQRAQRGFNYAIVDEVDNILIDEARTPLIISGQAEEPPETYKTFARLVPRLAEETDFTIDEKIKSIMLTDSGIAKMEKALGVPNLYDPQNYHLVHYMENALRAQVFFQRDKEYVIRDGEVVIVDEFTGRMMTGRRYSDGLHQAIEAKEKVKIQRESVTLATVTFQNYFRMYDKLSGMTGTAVTEAEEFHKIYNLDVVSIPTNKPLIRVEYQDQIYKNEEAKFRAVVREIEEFRDIGSPILVGTVSVENSEKLSDMLTRKGIKHNVLNAKLHEKEARIVSQAGEAGAVTIATNMAGRGVDILLGGNPEEMARDQLHKEQIDLAAVPSASWNDALGMLRRNESPTIKYPDRWAAVLAEKYALCDEAKSKVVDAGGLHIIGTERHEARRIDNQLRGRAGRQGDPGSSRFFVSVQDDIMRRFGGDRIGGIMERFGFDENTPIEHSMVSKSIESTQVRVEAHHFDIRKRLLEYDDVLNKHREIIYGEREKLLTGADLKANIQDMIDQEISSVVAGNLADEHGDEWNMEALLGSVGAIYPLPPDLNQSNMSKMSRSEIEDELLNTANELYDRKEQEIGAENTRLLERLIMLRAIDVRWREHLTVLENMRQGIGLQAYAQRDPLVAYKSQSHQRYLELQANIQNDIVRSIYHANISSEPSPKQSDVKSAIPAGKKVGRNDPCPCGSGKKYKKCCGKEV